MRVGMLQVYNEVNWVGYQIDQAVRMCDKLIIVEGSQFAAFDDVPARSTDGTLDIINDKLKEYSDKVVLEYTIRENKNYRQNQCANFNKVVSMCTNGDHFIYFDADEFFTEGFIEEANALMKEGKVDFLDTEQYVFAFSFNWLINIQPAGRHGRHVFYKVTDELKFAPTHRPLNIGPNKIVKNTKDIFHYTWVRPTSRVRTRMKTSGFVPGMLEWFNKYWDNIELVENKPQPSHLGTTFTLTRYDGEHPPILDNHPWRHVEDVRRV